MRRKISCDNFSSLMSRLSKKNIFGKRVRVFGENCGCGGKYAQLFAFFAKKESAHASYILVLLLLYDRMYEGNVWGMKFLVNNFFEAWSPSDPNPCIICRPVDLCRPDSTENLKIGTLLSRFHDRSGSLVSWQSDTCVACSWWSEGRSWTEFFSREYSGDLKQTDEK